jgi:PIN domain nuclease of toxin-antitoxin system
MIHVVDTHALTRYIEDYRRLGAAGRAIFDDPGSILALPTIALAEARFMIFRNKVQIVWDDILQKMESDDRLIPVPLTVDVLNRVPDSLEMHDGIIVATALMFADALGEPARVMTRDKEIRNSGLVETVW